MVAVLSVISSQSIHVIVICEREQSHRERDRERWRETDRQTDRQTKWSPFCFEISEHNVTKYQNLNMGKKHYLINVICVAPITQLRTCVIKIITFKRGHLMW